MNKEIAIINYGFVKIGNFTYYEIETDFSYIGFLIGFLIGNLGF